jgi:hypothetical protein
MKKLSWLSLLFITLFTFRAGAQIEVIEQSHDISRKSKKGYLGNVEVNESAGTFDMIYVLPSSARKVKLEIYTFDKQLQLINTKKEEEDIDLVRQRYKWFNFKGDVYYTNAVSASSTMGGKLVFRKKLITHKYRWWYGNYMRNVKMLDKVKPTSETEDKYVFRGGAYEVERDSNILVLAGRQESKNDINSYKNYDLLQADNNVNIKVLEKISFPYAYTPIFAEPLKDDNEYFTNDDLPRDWIVVFAPFGGKGFEKIQAPDPTEMIYMRITPEGKIVERTTFKAPTSGWRMLEAYEQDGSIFFYGPSISGGKGKYVNQIFRTGLVATTSADSEEKAESNAKSTGAFSGFKNMVNTFSGANDMGQTQEEIDAMVDEMTFTGFIVGRLTNGKVDFVKETPIAEFNSKSVKPASQKKPIVFDGKKFKTFGIFFTSGGDILINGQDFKVSKNKPFGPNNNAGAHLYKGVYMFQFDRAGNLKYNYGVELADQKDRAGFFNRSPLTADMYPAKSFVTESGDKSQLYWMMSICRAIHEEEDTDIGWFTSSVTKTWEPLFSIQYGTVDLNKGTTSEFKILGEAEKKNYYLFPSNYQAKMDQYMIYLSETERGDKVLLTRMDISK